MKWAFYYTERHNGVSLMTSTGRRNDTQIAKYQGLAGNRKEQTWDKAEHRHTCCGARVSWRHHKDCEFKKGQA